MRSLIAEARALVEERTDSLPLHVTFYAGGQAIPAKVTRLLKDYFELDVEAYTTKDGTKVSAETRKFAYSGEPYGSKSKKLSKSYERRYGLKSPPGIGAKDLAQVRVLSGRSPG
jgi:hypothetical protein